MNKVDSFNGKANTKNVEKNRIENNRVENISNVDRNYSLFAILTPECAERAENALVEVFSQNADQADNRNDNQNRVTRYEGEEAARAFLASHKGIVGVLRKMFVGHQIDVDKRYARALRAGECVLKVHIGQERSPERDRAETIILEAGGRDVYFFGKASYRDVPKQE